MSLNVLKDLMPIRPTENVRNVIPLVENPVPDQKTMTVSPHVKKDYYITKENVSKPVHPDIINLVKPVRNVENLVLPVLPVETNVLLAQMVFTYKMENVNPNVKKEPTKTTKTTPVKIVTKNVKLVSKKDLANLVMKDSSSMKTNADKNVQTELGLTTRPTNVTLVPRTVMPVKTEEKLLVPNVLKDGSCTTRDVSKNVQTELMKIPSKRLATNVQKTVLIVKSKKEKSSVTNVPQENT